MVLHIKAILKLCFLFRTGNKMKLLEKKNTMCNMKNMLDRINGKLDFVDKKINKPEYETIENV